MSEVLRLYQHAVLLSVRLAHAAEDLAAKLGISPDTLKRYLAMLRNPFQASVSPCAAACMPQAGSQNG